MKPITIIGGGLAGLSLGRSLVRHGVPTAVHEARSYPRNRVCGEFICGLSPSIAEELDLGPAFKGARQNTSIAWCRDGRMVRKDQLPTPAIGISRRTLDHRLADLYEGAGGTLATHSRINGAPSVEGTVWATGRVPGKPKWIGLKAHIRKVDTVADLEFHLGDKAYVGLSSVENEELNVCGLFARRADTDGRGARLLESYLRASGLGTLADRLTGQFVPESSAAVAAIDFRTAPQSNRLSIGDASGMIPPFTGDGMAIAFESAAIATAPMLAYASGEIAWNTAAALVRRTIRRRFRSRLILARTLQSLMIRPTGQRLLSVFSAAGLLPFRLFFKWLH